MVAGKIIDLVAEEGLVESDGSYLMGMLSSLVLIVGSDYDDYTSGTIKTEEALWDSIYSSLYYKFGVSGLEYADCPDADYDKYRTKWAAYGDDKGSYDFSDREHFEEI